MILKKILSLLPEALNIELKRLKYRREINKEKFFSDEPEYVQLESFISAGDWVVDIGANVGHYTKRFSDLVGVSGRVFAFEPIQTTFSMLSSNISNFNHSNVTLFNCAISDTESLVGMDVPDFSSGLTNYYRANITNKSNCTHSAYSIPLEVFNFTNKIKLIKIDVEGHEVAAINGMKKLLNEFKPIIILETENLSLIEEIKALGYRSRRNADSPNYVLIPLN